MKRILDCRGSDFRQMGRKELKQAIHAAEGRTILAETVVTSQPLLPRGIKPRGNEGIWSGYDFTEHVRLFQPYS